MIVNNKKNISKNKTIEDLKNKTKGLSLREKLNYLKSEYYDVISMIEAVNSSLIEVTDLRFTYRNSEEIVMVKEHENSHSIPDGIDFYIENIPPVIRVWDDLHGLFLGNDGNHRINTCEKYNEKVPIIIISINEF